MSYIASYKDQYVCRQAGEEDADNIHKLIQRAFAGYVSGSKDEEEVVNSALQESLAEVVADIKENIVLILERENKVVGSLRLEPMEDQKYYLKRFAIAPEYQNQGLGTWLFSAAEIRLKNSRARYIYLYSSLEDEKLVKFYQGLGFNCLTVDYHKGYERGLWIKTLK